MTNKAASHNSEDAILKKWKFPFVPRATKLAGGWDQASLRAPAVAHCSSCQLLGKGLGLGLVIQDLLEFCTKENISI